VTKQSVYEVKLPIQLRLLRYPEPVDVLSVPVDRAILGTALIGDAVLVVSSPVPEGNEYEELARYVTAVLQSVTAFKSRSELERDLHHIQYALIGAPDCMEVMRRYMERKGE
jgi:hypothetical protein